MQGFVTEDYTTTGFSCQIKHSKT